MSPTRNAVSAAADRVERELGPIDVWINAAMATVFSPIQKLSAQEIRRVTEVAYLGSVHGTLAALNYMRLRNRGTILQVGSALAYRGIPLQAGYCAAKSAIRGFLGSLRSELIYEGSRIRVCMVELPAVNTPQFDWARAYVKGEPRPVAPVFQPETIAEALMAAIDDPHREYWLGYSSVRAILGAQLMPQFLDRYLARHVVSGQQTDEPVPPGRIDNLDASATRRDATAGGRDRSGRGRRFRHPDRLPGVGRDDRVEVDDAGVGIRPRRRPLWPGLFIYPSRRCEADRGEAGTGDRGRDAFATRAAWDAMAQAVRNIDWPAGCRVRRNLRRRRALMGSQGEAAGPAAPA
jgi:short-subunit dehydrogenase